MGKHMSAALISIMLPIALLIVPSLASPREPQVNAPGLKITTRQEFKEFPQGFSTEVLYVKGEKRRRDLLVTAPDAAGPRHIETTLLACDQGRIANLFPENRTYVERRMPPAETVERAASPQRTGPDQTASQRQRLTLTIDTVDTGERRQVGSLVLRRVIETKTATPEAGATVRASVDVTDGWYVDVPHRCGGVWAQEFMLPQATLLNVLWRGDPERGYPVEMTRQHTSDGRTTTTTLALVEVSEAPLDDALFDLPAGYRPALPVPGGGFDQSKPDTMLNRAQAYWMWFAGWVRQVLR